MIKEESSDPVNVLFADGLDPWITGPLADVILSVLDKLAIFSWNIFNNHHHSLLVIAVNYTYLHLFKQTCIKK